MRAFLRAVTLAALTALPALAADDITSKMVNDPSSGWAPLGTAKVELFKDPTVQGGSAERLTIAGKATNPWDAGAEIGIAKAIQQGDVLLLAFWAKAETPPAGATTIDFNAQMQNKAAPYTALGSAFLHVGPQWKMYFVVGTADKDYKAKEAIAQLHLATAEQVIDLGPLFILNYGQGYDKTKLPKS